MYWMIHTYGEATPVQRRVYGSENDLDANITAACFLWEYGDTDMYLRSLQRWFAAWTHSIVYRYFQDRELPAEYDWRDILNRAVSALPCRVLDFHTTVDTDLIVHNVLKADWADGVKTETPVPIEEVLAKYEDKYADYTGQDINRELNQVFMRARFGGRGTELCRDMCFRISSVGFNWFNIIYDFVSEKKDELGIETVTIMRDLEGIGSKAFYRNAKGAVYDKMAVDAFLSEGRREKPELVEPPEQRQDGEQNEEFWKRRILYHLAKGRSFEVCKRLVVLPVELRKQLLEYIDEVILELKERENNNPLFCYEFDTKAISGAIKEITESDADFFDVYSYEAFDYQYEFDTKAISEAIKKIKKRDADFFDVYSYEAFDYQKAFKPLADKYLPGDAYEKERGALSFMFGTDCGKIIADSLFFYDISAQWAAVLCERVLRANGMDAAEAQELLTAVFAGLGFDVALPANMPQKAVTVGAPTKTLKVGDIVTFGEYDWRVLAVDGDKALIITENVIEERAYNIGNKSTDNFEGGESEELFTTWDKCSLREYLNGEFFNRFTTDEKARIADTTDKIFLLSIDEAVKYFGDSGNEARIAMCGTSFVRWRLRSPGAKNSVTGVDEYGRIWKHGISVKAEVGIRPALWLNL
jgi:hypothetical protein